MNSQSILSNIVVACLIGGLAMTVGRHGRRAALAHVLWVLFFVKLVTPPIWQWKVVLPHGSGFDWNLSWASTLWNLVFMVWMAGFALLLIRGFVASTRFASLLQREGCLDPEATAFVSSLLGKHRSAPAVIRLPVRLSPMLFGSLGSPKIVCPNELWELLTDEQRHAFLAHETAHFSRRDHWVRWLEWIVTAVYWWFPGVYFGRGQLERHEEACCDAWAVQRLGTTPRAYAETLLSVVDFVSEHETRLPRLTNGMQPTYTLEERLRLLMRPHSSSPPSNVLTYSAAILSTGLWLLHPTLDFHPRIESGSLVRSDVSVLDTRSKWIAGSDLKSTELYRWPSDHLLPAVPTGFWNTSAETKWADFTLHLGNARVRAEAGKGITIFPKHGSPLVFAPDDLIAMTEVLSTGRLIVGDFQGRLRLWDLEAGTPVSLIGQHNAPITSVTYHQRFGLVSADRLGHLIRWDIDSGLMLATRNFNSPIQSVRCSADGFRLAVMTGCWHECDKGHVSILESRNLEPSMQFVQPYSAATLIELPLSAESSLFHHRETRWFSINWQGELRSIQDTEVVLGQIQKDLVSSLVFAQQPVLLDQIAPPPPMRNPTSDPTEFIYVEQ